MVIEGSNGGSRYYVWGGGRWRELETAAGAVSGWGRVRFVVSRRGKLHIIRRGRVLAALRALAAGRRAAVSLGPRLPHKRRLVSDRRKSRSSSTQTAPVKHCHCCTHVENNRCALMRSAPGLSMPVLETEPRPPPPPTRASLADAGVQTSLTPRTDQPTASNPQLLTTRQEPATSSSTSDIITSQHKRRRKRKLSSSEDSAHVLPAKKRVKRSYPERGPHGRFLPLRKNPKREGKTGTLKPGTAYQVSSDSDRPLSIVKTELRTHQQVECKKLTKSKSVGETFRELMISDGEVALLRSFLCRCFVGFDRRRYDEDARYKAAFFYAINPLVSVERCKDIDRMLEAREHSCVDRFASRLGLRRSVSQTSSPVACSSPPLRPTSTPLRHSPRVRPAPAPRLVPSSTDSDTDKENFDTTSTRRITRGPIAPNNEKLSAVSPPPTAPTPRPHRKGQKKTSIRPNGSLNTTKRESHAKDDDDSDESKKESNDRSDGVLSRNKRSSDSFKNNSDAPKKHNNVKNNNDESKKLSNNDRSTKDSSIKRNRDRSNKDTDVQKSRDRSKKESNTKTRSTSHTQQQKKEKERRMLSDLDRIEVLSDERGLPERNTRRSERNNNIVKNSAAVDNNKGTADDDADIDKQLREKIKELDKKSNCLSKEYSSMEDHAIVAWISSGNRASLVNGNRIWRELEPVFSSLAGRSRSWHSLRNRYLRHLLPALGHMALPPRQQQQLRAAAARGEIKKHPHRRNSIFGNVDRGAASRVRPATSPSPPRSPPRTRQSVLSPRPVPTPSPPRTRKSLRYSEVTRQFAARHRSPSPSPSPSPPRGSAPPPRPPTRSGRRLYNPNAAL